MVPLVPGHTEETFFEDIIDAIPEGDGEAETLVVVRNTGNTILAPPVCTGTSMVMGEVTPSVAIAGVVLTDSSLSE